MNIDEMIKQLKDYKKSGVETVSINGNLPEFIKVSHSTLAILDTKKESL